MKLYALTHTKVRHVTLVLIDQSLIHRHVQDVRFFVPLLDQLGNYSTKNERLTGSRCIAKNKATFILFDGIQDHAGIYNLISELGIGNAVLGAFPYNRLGFFTNKLCVALIRSSGVRSSIEKLSALRNISYV